MREIGMAEEREGIPSLSGGSLDPVGLGFRIIVYKRQDGDRFGCDLRQCLVMSLNELLRHNRDLEGNHESAEPEATAPLGRFGLEGRLVWRQPCPWLYNYPFLTLKYSARSKTML